MVSGVLTAAALWLKKKASPKSIILTVHVRNSSRRLLRGEKEMGSTVYLGTRAVKALLSRLHIIGDVLGRPNFSENCDSSKEARLGNANAILFVWRSNPTERHHQLVIAKMRTIPILLTSMCNFMSGKEIDAE